MKRRKIACLSMVLIITTLLTGCSLGDIPVVGKLFNKSPDTQVDTSVDDQAGTEDDMVNPAPSVDAEYPAVPFGTVITVDDIFELLSPYGLSKETVAGYLILDSNENEANELVITEDTYFTFIYQMRDADVGEQSKLVIGVKVAEETVGTPDDILSDSGTEPDVPSVPEQPSAAKYEVFDYSATTAQVFGFNELENGKVYLNNAVDFDVHKITHSYEYESISKPLSSFTSNYTETDISIADKLTIYCIPKSFIYMQALDYEEGADMSAYDGEYVLIVEPIYDNYTDEIYRSEDMLLLPLIDDVNAFAKEPSNEAIQECDFLMDESFDEESNDMQDFYGSMEILMRLADTEDLFIFDDVLNVTVIDYSDMGTPDNMSDDVPWEEYEVGIIGGTSSSELEEGTQSSQVSETTTTVTGSTIITETTTTTTTESVAQTINEEVANSFRSRHPELFTFFPETARLYSKWDWRIEDGTQIKGTITLEDGTIIPATRSSSGNTYDLSGSTGSSYIHSSSGSSGSIFGSSSSEEEEDIEDTSVEGSIVVGDEGYETSDPEEEEDTLSEYEIKLGNTTCRVTSNNTYRYMIDSQNSSSSEVFINYKDKRYTVKVVDENKYSDYWMNDYLHRSAGGHTISPDKDYNGYTDADNTTIVLMNIKYTSGGSDVTEPYMAYIRNGSEYIIIIPDEAEDAGSEVLADILKRCISLQ